LNSIFVDIVDQISLLILDTLDTINKMHMIRITTCFFALFFTLFSVSLFTFLPKSMYLSPEKGEGYIRAVPKLETLKDPGVPKLETLKDPKGAFRHSNISKLENLEYPKGAPKLETLKDPKGAFRHSNIAVLSTFIPSTMWSDVSKEIKKLSDHILNRECYCHLWNYECIFNQTTEMGLYVEGGTRYDKDNTSTSKAKNPWWLQFAGWERVAHLQAALPNYDWILYGDLDYIIKDMSRPIESFIREFELYGKNDIHVLVPRDDNVRNIFAFSDFSVLIKNSPFGRRLVENWRAFGMGLCPNGNFEDLSKKQRYAWQHSDQVGLWYALMKTHDDFRVDSPAKLPDTVTCNKTSGLLKNRNYWLDMTNYFRKNGYTVGNYGITLNEIDDHQMIAWSKTHNDSMSGLGVNLNKFPDAKKFAFNAFALHNKKPSNQWDREMQIELGMCKKVHGCSVTWNNAKGIQTGCKRNFY